ncbi:hypothetical protein BHM03_00027792 [Ensete ventricosum]|nr:hypothetical protein BHM03_00027792 [Ensete ventricosum]
MAVRLHNLRCLHMEHTPLTHIPKGIGKLDKVNNLQGFVVGHEVPTKPEQGCALEELRALCKLSRLSISSLERAVSGAPVLAEKPFLKELTLGWTPPVGGEDEDEDDGDADDGEDREDEEDNGDNTRVEGARWSEEQIQGGKKICNVLSPPSSLRDLALEQFPALRLPVVHGAELPPLGTLPKLKFLSIRGAKALKTIGPEFVGHSSPAFPKLETLQFIDMPKWEEWSLEAGNGTQLKLLPSLKDCLLKDCPKLKALPRGLSYATNLKMLSLRQTYELREITNLPLADKLEVSNNMMLSRISDLSAVKYLKVYVLRLPESGEGREPPLTAPPVREKSSDDGAPPALVVGPYRWAAKRSGGSVELQQVRVAVQSSAAEELPQGPPELAHPSADSKCQDPNLFWE